MKWSTRTLAFIAMLVLLAGACTIDFRPIEEANAQGMEVIEVEVAENGYQRFSVDETPAFEEDGLPAYGAEFVTQGYLYPPGTITCDADGACNGVLEDGSPEFPDKVIGEWSCWGNHVGDGGHTTTGPWVVSNQLFSFGDTYGAKSISSAGYELADLNVPFMRSIVGGTGEYSLVRGEQEQEALGFDMIQGVTLRVKFHVARGSR